MADEASLRGLWSSCSQRNVQQAIPTKARRVGRRNGPILFVVPSRFSPFAQIHECDKSFAEQCVSFRLVLRLVGDEDCQTRSLFARCTVLCRSVPHHLRTEYCGWLQSLRVWTQEGYLSVQQYCKAAKSQPTVTTPNDPRTASGRLS